MLIHKTTRAGCTTALGSESLNRNEQVLMIVPTNMIAQKTIVKDMQQYSDMVNPHIIHIKSNHNCLINEELCNEYPDLADLPILPLPQSCEGCVNYSQCPITEIIRHPDADGIVLTYSKLVAAMLSSGGKKESMGDKIIEAIEKARNIVFDEVHEIQYGKASTLTYYDDTSTTDKTIQLWQYGCLKDNYNELWELVTNFGLIVGVDSTQDVIKEMKDAAEQDDFWKKHLSQTINNKFYNDIHYSSKKIKAIYAEIVELTKKREECNLSMWDIKNLYKIMNIVLSEKISIHSIRDKGDVKVNISAVDLLYTEMVRSFSMSMQNNNKRIMLTSATICSYDYSRMFTGETRPINTMFGMYGDPMNTNDKMTIYPDTKTYTTVGRYSFFKKKDDIIKSVIEILDKHGDTNCIIIAPNIKLSYFFKKELVLAKHEHDVTYYKSPDMMGVSNKSRVMIAIGIAYKPANAFDVITKDNESSQVLKHESIHADTWQAWSRVKDPSAKTDSYVYAIGVKDDICRDIIKWGYCRKVELDNTNKDKKTIVVKIDNNYISEPKIDFLTTPKTINQEQDNLLLSKYLVTDFVKKYHFNRYWYYCAKTVTRYFKRDINKVLLNRTDTYAEQNPDGSGYFRVASEISDKLIDNHIAGNITIGGYCLNKSNEVSNIVFDIDAHPDKADNTPEALILRQQEAEQDLIKLQTFLDKVDLPYITEASGSPHSYHIWLVLKPVKAMIAKAFGKEIMNDAGIKCEIFPKQGSLRKNDGYGNLIKLPFGINKRNGKRSMFQIDGEFVEEFDTIRIGEIDISKFKKAETKKRTKNTTPVPIITEVRPCIKSAIDKKLTGYEGHMMRIAITREYFNCGMTDPKSIVKLFSNQSDFDFEKSLMHVNSIISENYRVWNKQTLNEHCGSLINCDNCDHFQCKERYK